MFENERERQILRRLNSNKNMFLFSVFRFESSDILSHTCIYARTRTLSLSLYITKFVSPNSNKKKLSQWIYVAQVKKNDNTETSLKYAYFFLLDHIGNSTKKTKNN